MNDFWSFGLKQHRKANYASAGFAAKGHAGIAEVAVMAVMAVMANTARPVERWK